MGVVKGHTRVLDHGSNACMSPTIFIKFPFAFYLLSCSGM